MKDVEMYEALREDGVSKEKAARIANMAARTSRSEVGRKGGESGSCEDMTKDEPTQRARTVGIEGRSTMTKDKLVKALREH